MNFFDELKQYDEEIYAACNRELTRQRHNIELIASENIVSKAVLLAAGTVLTNKYAEGYPDKRYYGGCEYIDEVETLAIERAKKLFGADHANVQPHCGASATGSENILRIISMFPCLSTLISRMISFNFALESVRISVSNSMF